MGSRVFSVEGLKTWSQHPASVLHNGLCLFKCCDFQASLENYAVYWGVHYIVVITFTLGLINFLVYSSYLLCSAPLSAVLSGAKQISIVIVIITIVLFNSCTVSELNTRLLHISHKMLQWPTPSIYASSHEKTARNFHLLLAFDARFDLTSVKLKARRRLRTMMQWFWSAFVELLLSSVCAYHSAHKTAQNSSNNLPS